MSEITFFIPKCETVPTDLRLYVDDVYVMYERIDGGFAFSIMLDDEAEAMEVAKKIVSRMIYEHDEPQHGVSWRTISLEVIPKNERYRIGTLIHWKYRVRDSY